MSLQLKYIATVTPFLLVFLAMAAWMFWDFVDVQKTGAMYVYRSKYNLGLLFIPLCGFCIASGIFVARLGRLAIAPGIVFAGLGLVVAWTGLAMDTSNHHVRVDSDGVYSEWGTRSEPQSATIDFRELTSLSLVNRVDGGSRQRWLVATRKDGETVKMPVNDLLQIALKRIFANASAHRIQLELTVPMIRES